MNRVVTGYDENGSPAIIRQGEPPTVIRAGRYVTTELWVTDRTPPTAAGSDMSARAWALEPPPGGTCFRIVEIAPGGDVDDAGSADSGSATAAARTMPGLRASRMHTRPARSTTSRCSAGR